MASAGSASRTMTGMPCLPSASAHISPVGPAPATTTGLCALIPGPHLLDELAADQALEVLVVNVLALVLRHVDLVQDAHRLADVERALFRIERAVRGEDDLF